MPSPIVVTLSVCRPGQDEPALLDRTFASRADAVEDAREIAADLMRVRWYDLGPLGGLLFKGMLDDGATIEASVTILS